MPRATRIRYSATKWGSNSQRRQTTGASVSAAGAKANGTPFISFTPWELLALARECGLHRVEHISAESMADRYFANRSDGLRPPKNAEELIVART